MIKNGILILLIVNLVWQCTPEYENPVSAYQQLPPTIFAFLNTDADSQYVIITDATPFDSLGLAEMQAESGRLRQAKLTLTGNGIPLTFPIGEEFVRDSVWNFLERFHYVSGYRTFLKISTDKICPATDYQLTIEIPEKGTYTAATRTPGDFEILTPGANDTVDVDNPIHVRWTPAEGAAAYRISLWRFIEDSTLFLWGYEDEIRFFWAHTAVFVEPKEKNELLFQHRLKSFYTYSEEQLRTLLTLSLTIEAFDEPAWLAYKINHWDNQTPDWNFRFEVVSYSNIENGRGLMSAVTSKTIPLAFPKGQK